ncbi:MAG TPA: DUF4129 domain-containing protein [Pyrinomonadaceae bacterium]|nr:DUF4129 domain-containing protein [Pyrinomonadaceae bacterium]
MNARAHMPRRRRRRASHAKTLAAFLCASLCCFLAMPTRAAAAALEDYRARARQAAEAMEALYWEFDETSGANAPEFVALEQRTFQEVRAALPAHEKIEGAGVAFDVDNRWLHDELDRYAKLAASETGQRDELLLGVAERLRALDARLAEAANAAPVARDKEAEKGRLNNILRRREYNEQAAEDTALARLWKKFKAWLDGLMPKSSPVGEDAANTFSVVARLFVFALTAAVIIYVLWKYGAQLLPRNRARKQAKREPRVVLGERLAPGQTPADLIEQGEALARAGDLRGAIRKAYIAVLLELGERRVLRLAAHKTNRDYLSALQRDRVALYGDMQPLTHNYERHWYGRAPATDADWHDFRSRCREAIKVSG